MKTPPPPPTVMPPQSVRSPVVAAGLPLMKTLDEPSTMAPSPSVLSPLRAADRPPMEVLPLPSVTTPGAPGGGSPGRSCATARPAAPMRIRPRNAINRARMTNSPVLCAPFPLLPLQGGDAHTEPDNLACGVASTLQSLAPHGKQHFRRAEQACHARAAGHSCCAGREHAIAS